MAAIVAYLSYELTWQCFATKISEDECTGLENVSSVTDWSSFTTFLHCLFSKISEPACVIGSNMMGISGCLYLANVYVFMLEK
ncbi:hypothetical protein [Candidatus Clavichlamydia salmonicola]|uniref:hypothetical protein n=1 Tax=Candidatus Clavichlamydia salmonicola TaxID=469812 RepID=UPI0018915454|nr:hypothetical protein [Candidatus Clavichlamydia salmonicola]